MTKKPSHFSRSKSKPKLKASQQRISAHDINFLPNKNNEEYTFPPQKPSLNAVLEEAESILIADEIPSPDKKNK